MTGAGITAPIIADATPPVLVRLAYHAFNVEGCHNRTACCVTALDIVTRQPVARGTLCAVAHWFDEHGYRPDPFGRGLFKRPTATLVKLEKTDD